MSTRAPHFLLMSEATTIEDQNQWRFVLASADGDQKLVASDTEPATQGERLELLSVVRGLEALEQPSEVTLLTDSRYVSQGISHGLSEWRSNDWCWERFGELTPVKNVDLWQRVDHALKFHRVDCRTWRFDPAHVSLDQPSPESDAPVEVKRRKRPAASSPPRPKFIAARNRQREQTAHVDRPMRSEDQPRSASWQRPARQPGVFAACRAWLEQAAQTVLRPDANVSYEPQS